ncbi:MAG: ASCH domain-containing protein [Planctomycetes bacterium]|nr:ASCH domain-containing protein [Planctomycetota bacterium]
MIVFGDASDSVTPMLLFKKKFLDAIRSGEKTQTIRLWKHRMMRDGQRSYIPGVGYIRIALVQTVELDDLDEDDAHRDGFASAEALRNELQQLYREKLAAGHQAYRVTFRVLPAEEQNK